MCAWRRLRRFSLTINMSKRSWPPVSVRVTDRSSVLLPSACFQRRRKTDITWRRRRSPFLPLIRRDPILILRTRDKRKAAYSRNTVQRVNTFSVCHTASGEQWTRRNRGRIKIIQIEIIFRFFLKPPEKRKQSFSRRHWNWHRWGKQPTRRSLIQLILVDAAKCAAHVTHILLIRFEKRRFVEHAWRVFEQRACILGFATRGRDRRRQLLLPLPSDRRSRLSQRLKTNQDRTSDTRARSLQSHWLVLSHLGQCFTRGQTKKYSLTLVKLKYMQHTHGWCWAGYKKTS